MLNLNNISKTFFTNAKEVLVFKDFSLTVNEGEFVVLLGPSGCGKSTLLRILAGLDKPTAGEIIFDGNKIVAPGQDRGIVFQNFNLFPWLTVKENISFPLSLSQINKNEAKQKTENYLKATGLENFSDVFPKNLSGGMQQRVAIARTLAANPKMLLMDEPFGALDSQTRSQMQEFLTTIWQQHKKTVIFVTHDIREAIFLADKICILSPRPMTIKKVIPINFPRPRNPELKRTKEFFELENQIETLLSTP